MKALILATAMAVGFASYASAVEVKKDAKKAPVVASKAMTDKDMDKVTAAGATVSAPGPDLQVVLPFQASPTAAGSGQGNLNSFDGRAADRTIGIAPP